ncbi:MAG TPA: glycosyltransferase family 4 protein [Nitrospirales bacterium]|nr:glycosyltransferase WbuB [Nitrospiraceae bacterium]HNP29170.1 glycosyltransferase family 4 protein [Nitrospirales bacterium]
MRIAIVGDAYAPLQTSAAVQLRDLAAEFITQGHHPTMLIPVSGLQSTWSLEDVAGVEVLRVRSPQTKDVRHIRRTLAELYMPFAVLRGLRQSPLSGVKWDGVVWYSPSIFHGPLIRSLTRASSCRSYLILRDIFPEWAVDMGIMGRGLAYRFFKIIENYQYSVADVIGVQTQGNQAYFTDWSGQPDRRVEVLQNWLAEASDIGCSISVCDTSLAGRKIFVYAGNMGVAQGMGVLLNLAESLENRKDIGFIFVGRGSDSQRLRSEALARGLENVLFFDEIAPNEMPGLYAQCHVGLVALDPRHRTHNIPGKFVSYMQCGLPVLASINPGNDLVELIEKSHVGRVCTDNSVTLLESMAQSLVADITRDVGFKSRCKEMARRLFSPKVAVKQIVEALRA